MIFFCIFSNWEHFFKHLHFMTITLDDLNNQPIAQVSPALQGLYEHSDWVVEGALLNRPFSSFETFKLEMIRTLHQAGEPAWLKLIKSHPELTGKIALQQTLTGLKVAPPPADMPQPIVLRINARAS
jgi:2-oxo-4-hydroxy-4-carboxy--5-ureidoimidazoline (OHCU) decarboxylase